MRYCYNIFDIDDTYFADVFAEVVEPTAKVCGYEIYSINKQSSMSFSIDTAEKLIAACDICVADISTNNPNVWYKVGYAYSAGKKVILLHSDDHDTHCPFSVIGRNILKYSAKTLKDVGILRINLQHKFLDSDLADKHKPLTDLDIEVLNFINNLQNTPNEAVPKERIIASKEDIQGALKRLVDRKYVEYIYSVSEKEQQSSYYRVTQRGIGLLDSYWNGESLVFVSNASTLQMEQDGANSIQIGQIANGGMVNVILSAESK